MTILDRLENEAISILREAASSFRRGVILYSVGKDSSALLHLAAKAFAPGKIPLPIMHVDTGYKFPEMYEFRDKKVKALGLELLLYANTAAINKGTNPYDLGPSSCCGLLKTQALLQALEHFAIDAAISGARRDEEKSRAKERLFSVRSEQGRWDPRQQRTELWEQYNTKLLPGQSMRVFPLSNWTELDIWRYIEREKIAVVPLYFAEQREVWVRGQQVMPWLPQFAAQLEREGGHRDQVWCRYRSLGCMPCSGAVRSTAVTVADIIRELEQAEDSERLNRVIDHDVAFSMELKKREGYF
jgi:sulfate adenylyltransferase subunit 2